MVELFAFFWAYTAQCWRDLLLIPEQRLLSGQYHEMDIYIYTYMYLSIFSGNIFINITHILILYDESAFCIHRW